jgi:hypothetical protein
VQGCPVPNWGFRYGTDGLSTTLRIPDMRAFWGRGEGWKWRDIVQCTIIDHQVGKTTSEDCRKVRTMPSLVLVMVVSAFEALHQVSS